MSKLKIVIGESPISSYSCIKVKREIIPPFLPADIFMFENLQDQGQSFFDMKEEITLWLHEKQNKNGCKITGIELFDFLCDKKMILNCLNLQDGLAIKEQGVVVFKHFFGDSLVFFFKSVVLKPLTPKKLEPEELEPEQKPKLEVPYLYVDSCDILRIGSMPLEEKWKWNYFTPMLPVF